MIGATGAHGGAPADRGNGGNPAQVQSRVDKYRDLTGRLGVDPGGNLYC